MKRLISASLVAFLAVTILLAGGPASPGINRIIGSIANLSGLGTDVVDILSTTIDGNLGLAGRRVYPFCIASLRITSLTGTAPSAVIELDQTFNNGNTYSDLIAFTACTTACTESKYVTLGGLSSPMYPAALRTKHTTTGTSVTDLDYEIYLMCPDY